MLWGKCSMSLNDSFSWIFKMWKLNSLNVEGIQYFRWRSRKLSVQLEALKGVGGSYDGAWTYGDFIHEIFTSKKLWNSLKVIRHSPLNPFHKDKRFFLKFPFCVCLSFETKILFFRSGFICILRNSCEFYLLQKS